MKAHAKYIKPCHYHTSKFGEITKSWSLPVKKDLHVAEEQHTLLSQFFCLIVKTARLT